VNKRGRVAYVDGVHSQPDPAFYIGVFQLLVVATATIDLIHSLSNCALYVLAAATSSAGMSTQGITHRPEGLMATGTPLSSGAFVEADAHSRFVFDSVLVTPLASIPLAKQNKFLLLRSSLQGRLTHLTRVNSWLRLFIDYTLAERQAIANLGVALCPCNASLCQANNLQRGSPFGLRLCAVLLLEGEASCSLNQR
jgi:hypothetical protein